MANAGKDVRKPFEWLSGGLFFGRNQKDGTESVDSCKDPAVLLDGIRESFLGLLRDTRLDRDGKNAATDSAEEAASGEQPPNETGDDRKPTDGAFLEARLERLQFLLYDERRATSQQKDHRWNNASVATASVQKLAQATLDDNSQSPLLPHLVHRLPILQFESRKHVASIVNYLLVCGLDGTDAELYIPVMIAFVRYVEQHFEQLMAALLHGYSSASTTSDIALHCGSIYRSCIKHAPLYRQLVSVPARVQRYVYPFLDTLVHLPNFDISSDAMETLRHVLTAGCQDAGGSGSTNANTGPTSGPASAITEEISKELATLSADFLTRHYVEIWDKRFNPKLISGQANYMTKRVALQILSTVLLTRSNYNIMIQYVNSRTNLILIMKLLRDTSPHITLDAFHVFKVFVANPTKIPEVCKILRDNKEKLCRYLETLHQDREATDVQFRDEKALIIATIREL